RENKLSGKMFNYWTEGGFIAWGQDPDPNTGKTPLQLFMDGRAQAAYMRAAFDLWSDIMGGGPITGQLLANAGARGRELSADEYKQIGQWIDKQLKAHNAWVVLMPRDEFERPFVRGLENNPDWRLVFLNDKQRLFVDITTPRGRDLFEGIATGKTIYPDEFSRDLILAHNLLLYGREKTQLQQGLDFAVKAFQLNPSQTPVQEIMYAAQFFPELRAAIRNFCEDYLEGFAKNKEEWAKKDGYHNKIVAALHAANYLRQMARSQNDTQRSQSYNAIIRQYNEEQINVVKTKRW
ncbi:MAG TPA: hypothetical protein VMW16_10615, partial [Sedimentisphaerales bacterium]|nr:hypothetical protein [Sedimentisphaerales bacterium]